MPAINILIKPASSACNMGCKYCFYRDVAENRENAFTGMLSPDTMEYIIREAMEYAEGACTFREVNRRWLVWIFTGRS